MTTKVNFDELKSGDVLIDNLSVLLAYPATQHDAVHDERILLYASTLLEAVVLYDHLILDPLIRDSNSQHFEQIQAVCDILPNGTISYLNMRVDRKIQLFDSIRRTLPNDGFDWEHFIRIGQDREPGGEPGINTVVWELAEHATPEATSNLMHYFRITGTAAKHIYYLALSDLIQIPYVPNYFRADLYKSVFVARNASGIAKTALDESYSHTKNQSTIQQDIINYYEEKVLKSIDDLVYSVLKWQAVSVPIPALSLHIQEVAARNQCSLVEAAVIIRNSKSAIEFRNWCKEIQEACKSSKRKVLIKLMKSFTNECEKWANELDKGSSPKKAQLSLNFFGIGFQTDINLPTAVSHLTNRHAKHLVFLRDYLT